MFICRDDWQEWGPELAKWLEFRFSANVLDGFDPAREDDWIAWLDECQSTGQGPSVDCVEEFGDVLKSHFPGIRTFHATRLEDIEVIRRQGLRAWPASELADLARRVLGSLTDSETLDRAIAASNPEHRARDNGMLYTFASLGHALQSLDDSATGRLPSFAVRGGEFLGSVAMYAGIDFHVEGHAYFLTCDLPWSLLDTRMQDVIARSILETSIVCRFLDPTRYNMHGPYGSVTTTQDVAPEHISYVADVEHFIGRDDLRPSDIPWEPFHR